MTAIFPSPQKVIKVNCQVYFFPHHLKLMTSFSMFLEWSYLYRKERRHINPYYD